MPQSLAASSESKLKQCNKIDYFVHAGSKKYFPIYSVKSLEEFLDDGGLDDPLGDHRNSTDAYIEWGRRRSERVLMRNVTCMEFDGREETVGSLLNTICDTTLDPKAKTPIHFMHASPGVGKTRFFLEMVKMGVDKQKSYLYKGAFLNKKISMEKKEALLDDILHIAVSFNGRTAYKPKHITVTTEPEILSHITLRIMHIWLSKVSLTDLYEDIKAAVASGILSPRHLTLKSVLSLVSRRAGRKHIVLYVDEILKMYDSDATNDLVVSLSAEQDEEDEGEDMDKDKDENPPYSLRVCYSALKVDIFARARSFSGRDIISTPLPLISRNVARNISAKVVERAEYPITWAETKLPKYVNILTLLSGGHMRAMESLVRTYENLEQSKGISKYIRAACSNYGDSYETNIYGAVLLSLLGYSVPKDTIVNYLGHSITVEDMVASGRLMASFTNADAHLDVKPNMPLLSLIQWAFTTVENRNSNMKPPGYEVALTLTDLVDDAVGMGAMTGKKFESVCIRRHIIMRRLYNSLMEGNIVRNITEVDWRKATLKDYFKYTRCEGPISAEIANLTFDFTRPFPNEWELLKDDDAVENFFRRNYAEKRCVIGQPLKENFEANDYFLSLVSNCGVVVTVVVQTKFSSVNKTTRVNIGKIYTTLEKAMNLAETYGAKRNTIIGVAELWREAHGSGLIDAPMQLQNAVVQTKRELEMQVGPLMSDLIAFADL